MEHLLHDSLSDSFTGHLIADTCTPILHLSESHIADLSLESQHLQCSGIQFLRFQTKAPSRRRLMRARLHEDGPMMFSFAAEEIAVASWEAFLGESWLEIPC